MYLYDNAKVQDVPKKLHEFADEMAKIVQKADEERQKLKAQLAVGTKNTAEFHSYEIPDFNNQWQKAKRNYDKDKLNKLQPFQEILGKIQEHIMLLEETHKLNAEWIRQQTLIRDNAVSFMESLGLKRTVLYYKTTRSVKRSEKTAEWYKEICNAIPVTDGTYTEINRLKQILSSYERVLDDMHKANGAIERKQKQEQNRIEKAAKVLFYAQKYGVEADNVYELMHHVLMQNKNLKLGHHMLNARERFSEYNKNLLFIFEDFVIESDDEQEMIDSLIATYHIDAGGDGRIFRDCYYGYNWQFLNVDDELYSDYMKIRELEEAWYN